MYVEKLTIKNFRCFNRVDFDFNYPGKKQGKNTPSRLPNVNLLLGYNGTGKTSTFQALTIGALKTVLATSASGFRTERIIRYKMERADAIATLLLSPLDITPEPAEADLYEPLKSFQSTGTIKRQGTAEFLEMRGFPANWSVSLFKESHPGLFVVAYGANRRTARRAQYDERQRGVRYQRIASLFEPDVALVPLSLAYTQCMAEKRWEEVIAIINHLLPERVRLTNTLENDTEPLFDYEGVPLPLSALSDGYRLFTGWLIDLLTHLSRVLPRRYTLRQAAGIVIVDEVDLFLAPAWQRTVLELLANTFPDIQWLCSTHSPLVAGSLENENIFVLEDSAPFTSSIRRPSEVFEGKSVETVLSELFGVHQPRSPELERQLEALAQRAGEGDINASIEYLRLLNEGTARK